MQRTSFADDACSMGRALSVLGAWWNLLIIREAFAGATRFDQFQKRLGISRNSLTSRLRAMVEAGVLERRPVAANRSREEYVLTPMGEDLWPLIVSLRQWGDRWLFDDQGSPDRLVEAATGRPIPQLEVRSADGRRLERGAVRLVALAPET